MGLAESLKNLLSAPFANSYKGAGTRSPDIQSLQMVPMGRIQMPGDYISNRGFGAYTMWPSRPLSAQTRMKNLQYDLPSYNWTHNPEGPAYIVRVPGLPQTTINMPTMRGLSVQPEFLQPLTNLQIQNDMTFIGRFRQAIFGEAQQQLQANQVDMFPSVFADQGSIFSGAE